MGLFLKAASLTLCLGERRKLEALKKLLHLLPGFFCEALLELQPVSSAGWGGHVVTMIPSVDFMAAGPSRLGDICHFSWMLGLGMFSRPVGPGTAALKPHLEFAVVS